MKLPKIKVCFTWGEWCPLWLNEGNYISIGIGPLYIQLDWTGKLL